MSSSHSKKKQIRILIALALGLMLVCIAVSSITSSFLSQKGDWSKHEADGHQWLHQELNLTSEESSAIDAFEPAYREERAALQEEFQAKIEELRREITSADQFSDQARETIHELHLIHGQLQELSIRHYYEMMQVLPPEKQDRLRDIAAKALSVPQ